MNDLELLERYLQNEIDSGSHKLFVFDKDYNAIEFKVVNALSEIEVIEEEKNQLQSNWNSLREWLEEEYKKYDIGTKTYGQAQVKETLNKMNELEGKNKE